jgi:competence protein ComEC
MASPGSTLRAPLLWLLLPHLGGIALADACPCPTAGLIPLALVSAVLASFAAWLAVIERRGFTVLCLVALAAAGTGGGYLSLLVRLSPVVAWETTPREAIVTIEVDQVFPETPSRKTVNGLARIVATEAHLSAIRNQRIYFSAIRKISVTPIRSGQYRIRGVLQAADRSTGDPSGFERYLESRGIRTTLTRAQVVREEKSPGWFARFCLRAGQRMETILKHGVSRHTDAVAIYLGMLLGERAVLSPEQQDAFMRSGTFHIFVIAGLHVGVIAIAIQGVLQLLRVPRRTAVVAGLGLLWLYVQVTGAGLPARRAFLMIAFLQGARVLRRPWNSLAALTLAALVTLLLDPQQLFNAGFQMSYSVVTALVVMGAPLSRRWEAAWRPWRDLPEANWGWHRWSITWLGQRILGALAISWVALLASTPAMIGNFGLLSPGSLVANLVIIPLALSAISAGFSALVPGLFHLMPVSYFFNHAAVLLIKTMEWLVTHGAVFPGVYFPASFARPWMAPAAQAFVLATMLLGASLRWRRSFGGFWPPVLALVLAVFLGVKFG